jgi:hypothetical protein
MPLVNVPGVGECIEGNKLHVLGNMFPLPKKLIATLLVAQYAALPHPCMPLAHKLANGQASKVAITWVSGIDVNIFH